MIYIKTYFKYDTTTVYIYKDMAVIFTVSVQSMNSFYLAKIAKFFI